MISVLKIIRSLLVAILAIVLVMTTLLIMDVYNGHKLLPLNREDLDFISTFIIVPLIICITISYSLEKIIDKFSK